MQTLQSVQSAQHWEVGAKCPFLAFFVYKAVAKTLCKKNKELGKTDQNNNWIRYSIFILNIDIKLKSMSHLLVFSLYIN